MRTLYSQLMKLPELSDAFYYKDYIVGDECYRVFNYRLASYSDFLHPGALEARGITFYLPRGQDSTAEEVTCISRPWKKFFNFGENPFTMNLDLSKVETVAIKEDGSIISTFYNPATETFGVKSKQDFFSDQSIMATKVLATLEYREFLSELKDLALLGFTVIMELVSPLNRVVVPYDKTELRVLGIRRTDSGDRVFSGHKFIYKHFPITLEKWVTEAYPPNEAFLNQVETMTGIEGFVFTMEDGLMFKVKTEWYKALHHLKDSVSSAPRLFNAIILETVDDIKTMFPDDTVQLQIISDMEDKVIPKFNQLISIVEHFYEENKHLNRKDFAIKGQKELGMLFSLAMGKYLGKFKESSYKDFAIKNRVEYFEITEGV